MSSTICQLCDRCARHTLMEQRITAKCCQVVHSSHVAVTTQSAFGTTTLTRHLTSQRGSATSTATYVFCWFIDLCTLCCSLYAPASVDNTSEVSTSTEWYCLHTSVAVKCGIKNLRVFEMITGNKATSPCRNRFHGGPECHEGKFIDAVTHPLCQN